MHDRVQVEELHSRGDFDRFVAPVKGENTLKVCVQGMYGISGIFCGGRGLGSNVRALVTCRVWVWVVWGELGRWDPRWRSTSLTLKATPPVCCSLSPHLRLPSRSCFHAIFFHLHVCCLFILLHLLSRCRLWTSAWRTPTAASTSSLLLLPCQRCGLHRSIVPCTALSKTRGCRQNAGPAGVAGWL
jgi:hypothetical protein